LKIAKKTKVCFVSGKFNVIHAGHLRLFRHAREIADRLVVGVFADDYPLAGDILVTEEDRIEGVRSNIWVDEVVLVTDIEKIVSTLKPDIVLKGREHEKAENLEESTVSKYGGVLRFAAGDARLSSSTLIQAETNRESKALVTDNDFLRRHNLSRDSVAGLVESVSCIKTLVIGDLIVDRYVDCQPVGLSAEDPTVVVSPLAIKSFIGGAGIVAAHAAHLGAQATLVSIRGDDDIGEEAVTSLDQLGVCTNIWVDGDRPTTRKTRYRASGKTLLRVNELRDHLADEQLLESLLSCILDMLPQFDLLIFSDFSYGLFTDTLINEVTRAGKQLGITMAADSQSSSQIGDITKFQDVTLLTPTEREARLAVRDNKSGLVGISEKIRDVTGVRYVPITLASEGVFLHVSENEGSDWVDDQVPALNKNPADVSGAGDAFLVGTAMCLAAGADIWSSIYFGSLGSACQISRIGNVPLSGQELIDKLYS